MDVRVPEAFEDLWLPSRYKAYYGGRGSAKSHSFAIAALSRANLKPLRVLCTREVQLSIKDSVKQLLDDKISAHFQSAYESRVNTIIGRNGSEFIFAGLGRMTVDQLKSYEGVDICWVEEAQTISARSLEVLIPTVRKAGSEIWFSWNPRHAADPVDARFRGEHPPPDSIIRRVSWKDNPWFTKELEVERLYDRDTNPDRYGHIWDGEYEPMAYGAIWDRAIIAQWRKGDVPELSRIVVAVDPATSTVAPDTQVSAGTHGIIVAGLGEHDDRGYVIEDASIQGDPHTWATQTIAAFDRYDADCIVVEINQGGDMVKNTLTAIRPGLPIKEVRATRGKHVRAEPIAALYRAGRISHCGTFTRLEDQMVQMTAAGYEGPDESPDHVDALVWAMTELFDKMTRVRGKQEDEPFAPAGNDMWMV